LPALYLVIVAALVALIGYRTYGAFLAARVATLDDLRRTPAHTLGDAEERILAAAGPLSGAPADIYTILSNADFPYPTVTLSDGRTVAVPLAWFPRLLRATQRQRGDWEPVIQAVAAELERLS